MFPDIMFDIQYTLIPDLYTNLFTLFKIIFRNNIVYITINKVYQIIFKNMVENGKVFRFTQIYKEDYSNLYCISLNKDASKLIEASSDRVWMYS